MFLLLALPWTCSGFVTTRTTTSGATSSSPLLTHGPRPDAAHVVLVETVRGVRRPRSPSLLSLPQDYYYSSPAVVLKAHSADAREDRSSSRRGTKRAWPHRIWSKLRRGGRESSSSSHQPLRMQVMDAETEALLDSVTSYYQAGYGPNATSLPLSFRGDYGGGNDDFILRNFEDFLPRNVLSEEVPKIDAEFYNVTLESAAAAVPERTGEAVATSSAAAAVTPTPTAKAAFVSRWLGTLFENILTGIIQRNAKEVPEGLHIQAFPKGNAMAALLRGQFRTDAELNVGRLVFPALRISSGRLEIQRLTLHIWGFLGQQQQQQKQQGNDNDNDNNNKSSLETQKPTRFPKQFDLHAHDWTFSRHDLLFSPCIRNGLRLLLVRILRDRGVQSSSIQVTSIDILVRKKRKRFERGLYQVFSSYHAILPCLTIVFHFYCVIFNVQSSGKISVKGQAKTLFDSPLNFEVRSGIDFSSRGHVLTFPGLEVSVTGDLGLFVPVVPTIDIDVGHNARFREIHIDGRQKMLRLSASVTITPKRTIRLNEYQQSKEAFSARFSTDVGQWLTNLGNFKH